MGHSSQEIARGLSDNRLQYPQIILDSHFGIWQHSRQKQPREPKSILSESRVSNAARVFATHGETVELTVALGRGRGGRGTLGAAAWLGDNSFTGGGGQGIIRPASSTQPGQCRLWPEPACRCERFYPAPAANLPADHPRIRCRQPAAPGCR